MRKKYLTILGLVCLILLLIPNTYALKLAEAGDNVKQEGEYDSVRLIAGNTVSSTARIDGISLVAGNTINVSGSSQYGFYAGNALTINETVERDAFIAGSSIVIGSDAVFGRDLFIAGDAIVLGSNVTRNLYVGSTRIDLSGVTINGNAYIDAKEITMDEETRVLGTLNYLESAKIIGMNEANMGEIKTHKDRSIHAEYNFKNRIYDLVFSMIGAFIVVMALFYINPKAKEKLDNVKLEPGVVLKAIGAGALVLLIIPITAVLALFTGVLAPIAIITLLIYGISIYLSTLLSGYVIGNTLAKKVFKVDSVYLAIITGILIVNLVSLIPYVGGLLIAALLSYGMGLIYKYFASLRR